MSRLLVGIDDREGGRDALALARALSGGGDAGALVVTVLYSGPLGATMELLAAEQARDAESLFAAAREELAPLAVETRAYAGGSPAAVLTTLAEAEEFDAIVVGSSHRGVIGRVIVGNIATSLLNGAPADVAVAPKGYAMSEHEPPRAIAVAYDGTPEAKLALQRAEAIARRSDAALKLLTVVVPPLAAPAMVPGVYAPQTPPQPEEVMREALDSVDPALTAEAVRLDGDPALELGRACERDVDLLVVGSRSYGPLTRALLGSVSRALVKKAVCPLLVARRP